MPPSKNSSNKRFRGRGGRRRNNPYPSGAPRNGVNPRIDLSHQSHREQQQGPFQPVTKVVNAQALGPSLPSLVITYTNEQDSIVQWLTANVLTAKNGASHSVVGFDTETKPCFTREAAQASRGPDTLQLAKSDGSCLVVHLARMERQQKSRRKRPIDGGEEQQHPGFDLLSTILSSKTIAKAGVSIDDDAIELHKNHFLDTSCRVDLSDIHYQLEDYHNAQKKPSPQKKQSPQPKQNGKNGEMVAKARQPIGLKALAEQHVPNLTLPKRKKLQMSNWQANLSKDQIGYAAADAYAGAAVLDQISANNDNPFTVTSLLEGVVDQELDVHLVEEDRKQKKLERKRRKERERQRKKS